jgi:hypothetical protein
MNKKNKQVVEMTLYSRIDLSSEKSLELRKKPETIIKMRPEEYRQIKFWSCNAEKIVRFFSEYKNGSFQPDKCNTDEPIRELFNPYDLTEPIRWLSQVGSQLMLKRLRPLKYLVQIENKRRGVYWITDKGKTEIIRGRPDPLFLTYISFWINGSILRMKPIEFIRRFLIDICAISDSDFGYVGMEDDVDRKNLLRGHDKMGDFQQFVGNNPEYGIPGIYWINIFGKTYVDWFGRDKFLGLECYYKEELESGGFLIQCSENPNYYDTEEGVIAKNIINHLGPDAFFDITRPDEKCITPFSIID